MKHHIFIGIDRSDQTIDIALLDSKGQLIKQDKVDSSPESLQLWVSSIREDLPDGSTAAICIEQPCKNLTSFFREFDFLLLYLINPSLLKNYLKSLSSTTAKDDKRDSLGLARMLFERHRELAPWKPSDTITEQLSELTTKRRQSFVEWAGQTVNRSIWAKAYYEQQKAKGKRHQSILRGLAYKWQRILFRLWKSNEVYSENHYLKALEKSESPLVQVITQLKQQQQKECEQI